MDVETGTQRLDLAYPDFYNSGGDNAAAVDFPLHPLDSSVVSLLVTHSTLCLLITSACSMLLSSQVQAANLAPPKSKVSRLGLYNLVS